MHHATHLQDWTDDLVLLENGVPVMPEEEIGRAHV